MFTIAGSGRVPPVWRVPPVLRTERGDLDIEAITLAWLGWRRLECGGADMGGVHAFGCHPRMWTPVPRFRPVELDDRLGRHVPRIERHYRVLAKAVATLESAGAFGL